LKRRGADKSNGSFAGKTTVDQLRAIHEKIIAVLKGEDAHVLIVSKLSDIAKGHEKRKQAAVDAISKKKTRK
jgi:hypothetical protein